MISLTRPTANEFQSLPPRSIRLLFDPDRIVSSFKHRKRVVVPIPIFSRCYSFRFPLNPKLDRDRSRNVWSDGAEEIQYVLFLRLRGKESDEDGGESFLKSGRNPVFGRRSRDHSLRRLYGSGGTTWRWCSSVRFSTVRRSRW